GRDRPVAAPLEGRRRYERPGERQRRQPDRLHLPREPGERAAAAAEGDPRQPVPGQESRRAVGPLRGGGGAGVVSLVPRLCLGTRSYLFNTSSRLNSWFASIVHAASVDASRSGSAFDSPTAI